MKQKKVFIWYSGIDDFLNNTGFVGGIIVQLSFWAQTFAKNGWKVYSFSANGFKGAIDGIQFISQKYPSFFQKYHISFFLEFVSLWRGIIKVRPNVVIARGSNRDLYMLSILCRLMGVKFIFMGASDTNFIQCFDDFCGSKINWIFYSRAIKHTDYVVAQNQRQADDVKLNYAKEPLILPNLWIKQQRIVQERRRYAAIWVSNFTPNKRAEWFIRLAHQMRDYAFAIVGGPINKQYYDAMRELSQDVDNLDFLGPQSFFKTSDLVAQSSVLVCTSGYEGFPNTFLQAWANEIPVVSTVDPSNVIASKNLGRIISSEESLEISLSELLADSLQYAQCVSSVKTYFDSTHSSDMAYQRLIDYIGLNE